MKMNWWLKLYTIPALIEVMKAAGISLAIDLVTSHFLNLGESGYGLIAYVFLLYRIMSEIYQNSMGRNISFHKSHHNFFELDRALLNESLTYSFGVILVLWVTALCSNLFGGGFDSSVGVGNLIFHSYSVSILFTFSLFLFLVNLRTIDKKVDPPLRKTGLIGRVVYFFMSYALIILFSVLSFFIASFFKLEIETLGCIYILGVIFAGIVDRRRLFFHLRKKEHSIRSYIKWSAPGLGFATLFFFMISFFAGRDFSNKKLTADNKVITLDILSNFSPRFELDDFKTILPYTDFSDANVAYLKAPIDLSSIPVEEILSEINSKDALYYVKYSHPSERNMNYLSDYMLANIDKWKEEYSSRQFVNVLVKKCKNCWVNDSDKKIITEKTKYEWPKDIKIERRSIASDPIENESEEI